MPTKTNWSDSGPRPLVAVYGPTSSGKTRLSIELCLKLADANGIEPVVISADSRQVYRHLDIGTSKTTPEQMRGIRHEMISVADPVRKYALETYVDRARGHIDECWSSGRLPVIVGGTAVYVQALLEGWDVTDTAKRTSELRKDFPRAASRDAYETLRRIDRAAAGRVHPNNYDAVINALARRMAGNGGGREPNRSRPVRSVVLGLDQPVRKLDARVARTFDEQMEQGLFDEVMELSQAYDLERELRQRGKDSPNQVLHTHGYREFFEVARDRSTPVRSLTASDLEVVRERAVDHIRAYTRRQRGAFRKLAGLQKIASPAAAYDAIRPLL